MTQNKTLRLERIFDCTPERMWAAWTDPKQYAKWLNPAPGLDLVIHEFDVRPGGRVRFDMPQPDGNKNPQEGVFHSLDPYREIVTGEPDKSFLIKVNFEPTGSKRTRLTVEITGLPPEWHEPATVGWNAGFDKLAGVLATGERDIVIVRTINAPRERVFEAWTDADALGKWWGPNGFTTTTKHFDFRPGGAWEQVMHGPDGADYPNFLKYVEIVEPERILYDHGSSSVHPGGFQNTVTFEEAGEGTTVTMRMRFPTIEERDKTIEFGAVSGGQQTLARLAGHVEADGGKAAMAQEA